jgi:tetratricopeptide (TPR) repeat protein
LLVLDPRRGGEIEQRKTTARDIGDAVLFLAGLHALEMRHDAGKALALFERLSRTPTSLRYRARALMELKRRDEAMAWAREATALDPTDRSSRALLGQLYAEAGRLKEAMVEYRRALPPPDGLLPELGFFDGDHLYIKEFRIGSLDPRLMGSSVPSETGYLLAVDAAGGTVRERHRLPGVITNFAREGERVLITVGGFSRDRHTTLAFSHGRFETPLHYGGSSILRRQLDGAASSFASGLMEAVLGAGGDPLNIRRVGTPPRTIAEIGASLRQIIQTDPTQPWHRFHLGVAQRALGRAGEAVATFAELFEGAPVGLPYYEFAWLANAFERLGEPEWADRAFKEALARRRRLPQPVGSSSLLELLANAPFVRSASEASVQGRSDPDRLHLWLTRGRELMGPTWEAEDFATAAWERYYRSRGEAEKARREAEHFRHVRAGPLNVTSRFARLEYALRAWAAITSAWVAFLALVLTAAGGPLRARLAAVPPRSRRVALATATLAVAAGIASVDAGARVGALMAMPIGAADSIASLAEEFEERTQETGAAETAYAAAVAHHAAGHAARAADLYRELPGDGGVRENRSALARGQLMPPRPLNDQDLVLAYVRGSFRSRLRNWRSVVQELGPVEWLVGASVPGVVMVVILGSMLALAFWRVAPMSFPAPVRANGGTRRLHVLVPGAFDVRHGAPTRGYVCLLGLAFVVWILLGVDPGSPAPGPLLRLVAVGWGVVPFPPASAPGLEALKREHYWTVFWAYPHAQLLWALVGLAGASVLVRHAWQVRRLTHMGGHDRTTVVLDMRGSGNPPPGTQ